MFGSLFGKKKANEPTPIRETLFGDMPLEQWPSGNSNADAFPWSAFITARTQIAANRKAEAVAGWQQVLAAPGLEPRQYLQAWHFLRQEGQPVPQSVAKQVLGVVVEVAMPKGLDLVAAYPDHTARYYNYSGAGVIWEHPDQSLDTAIDRLLDAARIVTEKIGPWDKERPAPPTGNQARISFLTPSGLHFGQASMNVLSQDPLGGRVVQEATTLMMALIEKSKAAKQSR